MKALRKCYWILVLQGFHGDPYAGVTPMRGRPRSRAPRSGSLIKSPHPERKLLLLGRKPLTAAATTLLKRESTTILRGLQFTLTTGLCIKK